MVNNKKFIPIILIFIIGLSVISFPFLKNSLEKKSQLNVINEYNIQTEILDSEQCKEILDKAKKYNEDLLNYYESTFQNTKRYEEQISLSQTDIMGYIEIEKINAKIPIYHGTSEGVLQEGVGHLEGSSLPIGGESTHAFLFGHRGLPTSELFTRLNKMEIDDYFIINILNERNYYKVVNIEIIEPEELESHINIDQDKDQITLVTCTPYGINSHRLLVTGERVFDYSSDEKIEVLTSLTNQKNNNKEIIINAIGILIVFMIFIGIIVFRKKMAYINYMKL